MNKIFDISKERRKLFKCPLNCGRVFRQKSNLNTHMRIHTGHKPFKCTFKGCLRQFTTSGNLKSHLSLHTGEKHFACPFSDCGKRYFLAYRLKIHQRTHCNDKPFRCNYCDKSFNEKGNLKIHERIHTGERPYECRVCCTKFKTQGHLRDHMKRHLKEGNCSVLNLSATIKTIAGSESVNNFPVKLPEVNYDCSKCNEKSAENCYESLRDSLNNKNKSTIISNISVDYNNDVKKTEELVEEKELDRYRLNFFWDDEHYSDFSSNLRLDDFQTIMHYKNQQNDCCNRSYDFDMDNYSAKNLDTLNRHGFNFNYEFFEL